MRVLLYYIGAFEVKYGLKFVNAGFTEIPDDTLPSRYLPFRKCSAYVGYTQFAELLLKSHEPLRLLQILRSYVNRRNILGTFRGGSFVLYRSESDKVVLNG